MKSFQFRTNEQISIKPNRACFGCKVHGVNNAFIRNCTLRHCRARRASTRTRTISCNSIHNWLETASTFLLVSSLSFSLSVSFTSVTGQVQTSFPQPILPVFLIEWTRRFRKKSKILPRKEQQFLRLKKHKNSCRCFLVEITWGRSWKRRDRQHVGVGYSRGGMLILRRSWDNRERSFNFV